MIGAGDREGRAVTTEGSVAAPARVVFGEFENSGPRHDYREGHMVRFIRRIRPPPARLLDAGCGNGSLSLRLARAGYDVTGIDLSPLQLARARDKSWDPTLAGSLRIVHGSITQLPFAAGHFAGATCGEVLEHVPEDGAAAREIARVLAPGGCLVLTVPFDPTKWDDSDVWHGHVRRYTRESMRWLLEQAGFRVERTFIWGFPLVGLYHRRVFLPWVRRARALSGEAQEATWVKRVGSSRPVRALLSALFHVDDLFSSLDWGIGLLAVARRADGPS